MDRIEAMQLVQAFQQGTMSRRAFVRQATLTVGSLSAVNLLLAACAATPPDAPAGSVVQGSQPTAPLQSTGALTVGDMEYAGPEGTPLSGFLARPSQPGTRPAVVLVQEWWGLNEHIREVARRLASEGFVVLAPDLYHGTVVSEPDEARKLVMELDMAAAVREIEAAVRYLQAEPGVRPPEIGVMGFCMGGGLALQSAATIENGIGAVVAFYGTPLAPDEAARVRAPVLGLFGAEDSIPRVRVEAMAERLTEGGVPNQIHFYEGAGHAFFNDTRPSYVPDAADDAWTRTLAWFRQHLA